MKSKDRIGKVYKKTVYREFTDGTFQQQKLHRKDLGILGPIIRGEIGDALKVVFKNMAKRQFSMHPHGLSYAKSSEGALYRDNTTHSMKKDNAVAPGMTHTYEWFVKEENGPLMGDQQCIASVYHSHTTSVAMDINTGLIGLLLACKKGSLNYAGTKLNDVDKEMFLLQNVFDENKSWYLDDNLRANRIDPALINKEDEDFMESNLMHGINGRFYGNLEGLDLCIDSKVAWYLAAFGNTVDMHTAAFTGHMVKIDHHQTDVTSLFPSKTASAMMNVENPGRWMFSCKVADHYSAGMFVFYDVHKCGKDAPKRPRPFGQVREYFIAAEEEEWAYATTPYNRFDGGSLSSGSSGVFFRKSFNRIGGKYIKARYVEYTDSTFTVKKLRSPDERHLGLMGPVIKAEVGDVIQVIFQNKASRPYSIHPRGVWYDKANEGFLYKDNTTKQNDDRVYPGSVYTYEWFVPKSVSPTDQDPPCVARLYSSNVEPVKDMYSGLLGPLVICKTGSLKPNGVPKGYDAERYLLMAVMDENKSWYLDRNMQKYCTLSNCFGVSKEDDDFQESNKMHQINGHMYGHIEGLDFCQGSKILWHTFVVGTETDVHAIYFHGNGFNMDGNNKDALTLFPGASASFTMMANNVGKWGLVCKVNDHYNAGMKETYEVKSCGKQVLLIRKHGGMTRTYYIGIIETDWNYAPNGKSMLQGFDLASHEHSKTYTKRDPGRLGSIYKKAVYREFTDATFTKQKRRTMKTEHLGILGPIIRAEEGDEIKVVLKNMASRSYSIHPHGVFYDKENEGALYKDGKTRPQARMVPPNTMHTYNWFVPKRAAPGPNDGPCNTYSYYSAVDTVKDTNTGLLGPLITCRKGTLNQQGERADVDKEFALLFTVMDENESWYLKDNIQKRANSPATVQEEDESFKESNRMHSINGFIYGNGPNNGNYLIMKMNDRVVWYVIGFGNEVDIHTLHFHGNDFIHRTNTAHRDSVYNIFPGVFQTLEMRPKHKGTWLLHCHVHDHLDAGMETRYTVYGDEDSTGTSSSDCKDKFTFCSNLRHNCNNQWVKKNCRKSCNSCSDVPVRPPVRPPMRCVDDIGRCKDWASFGYCNSTFEAYKRYMEKYCRKSCRRC
eukprot:Seg2551.1 transcript_id=Seg2551.1/GoldUCD/mRNA.D3Y31 product="Hephaestin-like protein" protein_id=Seg2551.1/GoldUCD/D3Y31